MPTRQVTTIKVKDDTHSQLTRLKDDDESFDDVVTALLDDADDTESDAN